MEEGWKDRKERNEGNKRGGVRERRKGWKLGQKEGRKKAKRGKGMKEGGKMLKEKERK